MLTIKAVFLVFMVTGGVELVKALWPQLAVMPAQKARQFTVLVVLLVAIAMTFLVRATVWAHAQVIGGQHLDKLSIASTLCAAIALAFAAAFTDKVLTTAANLGQNQPKKPLYGAVPAVPGEKVPSDPAQPNAQ